MGAGSKKASFSEYGNVAYLIIRNDACSNTVANILPADPPSRHEGGGERVWSNVQNSNFSEYGYFAYQIKVNYECSNMVANLVAANPSHEF